MKRYIENWILITLFIALMLTIPEARGKAASGSAPEEQGLEAGRLLYEKRCAHCHGVEGRGDGPVAPFLDPAPRDFTSAQFKIRTTPRGSLPTDEDLFKVITNGLPGTAMEGWEILSEEQRWQLVRYIKTFVQQFGKEEVQSINLKKNVSLGAKAIERGQELYRKMKCFLCHGEGGKGDGPVTVTLRIVWISTGMAGTPMDAYTDYLSSEERWYLAAFVKSLQSQGEESGDVVLKSQHISGELPIDPDEGRWDKMKGFVIPLSGQVIQEPRLRNPSIDLMEVKSCYNEREIAFLLQWDDRTETRGAVFQDAVAVQFPVKTSEGPVKPYFFMGQPGKSVNLWKWEAGNDSIATELVASGIKSVKIQPDSSQQVKAKAMWENGRWRVVLHRSLRTQERILDTQFETGKLIPMAFSVWDGANREIGLRKSLSSWYYLVLETSKPVQVYIYALLGILVAINFQLWLIRKVRQIPVVESSMTPVGADQYP
ncbi:MAG: ethylbenzene dehydrogenase-related protein [bacterium]